MYLLFYSRMSLILCCFFAFKLFIGIFVKCFWQFGYGKFHSLCDFKLAIIKLSAYPSTYGLLIRWLIFCCRVNFYGSSLRYSPVEIRQNTLKPGKIYNKLKFGTMAQDHVLSHQKKIPMFWTRDFPLFRP